MHEIKPGIYYEDSYPGPTIGAVLLPHGMMFIDTPLRPEDAHRWKSTLLNRSQGTIHRIVICLDDHPDRTIGANGLDCPILTHRDAAETLKDYSAVFRGQLPESGAIWERYPETTGLLWVVPDITFSESMKFHWGEPDVLVEHHPGPRPGSSWVIIPDEKVVFIGDTVVKMGPPFFGKAHIPTWIEALDALMNARFRDYIMISGRGGEISQDDIKDLKKSIRKIHRRIEKLASRQVRPEEAGDIADKTLDDYKFPKKDREFYLQRLRHGLTQYYVQNYLDESLPGG